MPPGAAPPPNAQPLAPLAPLAPIAPATAPTALPTALPAATTMGSAASTALGRATATVEQTRAAVVSQLRREDLLPPPPVGLKCVQWHPQRFMADLASAQSNAWLVCWPEADRLAWIASFEEERAQWQSTGGGAPLPPHLVQPAVATGTLRGMCVWHVMHELCEKHRSIYFVNMDNIPLVKAATDSYRKRIAFVTLADRAFDALVGYIRRPPPTRAGGLPGLGEAKVADFLQKYKGKPITYFHFNEGHPGGHHDVNLALEAQNGAMKKVIFCAYSDCHTLSVCTLTVRTSLSALSLTALSGLLPRCLPAPSPSHRLGCHCLHSHCRRRSHCHTSTCLPLCTRGFCRLFTSGRVPLRTPCSISWTM